MYTDYFRMAVKCSSGKGGAKRLKAPSDFDYSEKIVKNKLRVQGLSDVVVNFEELCNI